MKKILNERGMVTGLLSKVELEAMKDAISDRDGITYIYNSLGWQELYFKPDWNLDLVYKVEYEEKEMIPFDKNDVHKLFLDNTVVKRNASGVEVRIKSFDPSEAVDIVYMNDWIGLDEFLRDYTHRDGSKFEKEAKA